MFGTIRTFINIAASIIEIFLTFRLVFKFLPVNPRTPFVAWLYGVTERLVSPFANILPNWRFSGFVIDFATLAALIVYAVAGSVLLMILPRSRKDTDVRSK
jgi:YggT family protein